MISTPKLPQGTRDFGPEAVRKRNFIFNTLKAVFELHGFQPLETPAMEQLETLLGKYGEEGDQLIFKILNNGLNRPEKQAQAREQFEKVLEGKNVKDITERALRYDLTIPFARYVATHHGSLVFPFKRYQMQPVWRADKPQKNRYREFYQCDADVVGSTSLLNELDLIRIYQLAFHRLGLAVEIRMNHRKILAALAEACGVPDKLTDITVAIDKLDKTGLDKVKEELAQRQVPAAAIATIEQYLQISGDNEASMEALGKLIGHLESGRQGIADLSFLLEHAAMTSPGCRLVTDFTLARGLNYYTGPIFEVKATQLSMGSIGGGGRYDDLTGLFGLPNIPGVGISFGVDRIYDAMEELNLFPATVQSGTRLLFFNLGPESWKTAFRTMQQLRESGISCEMFHEQAKFDKQFKYATRKQIPYAALIGEAELAAGNCIIKNLTTGEQTTWTLEELVSRWRPD